jgi:hypothetical protein
MCKRFPDALATSLDLTDWSAGNMYVLHLRICHNISERDILDPGFHHRIIREGLKCKESCYYETNFSF